MDEGHLHVTEILVKNGADVNYRNKVRALIPVTQVCIMWPMIRHCIMVNQWDVQGMSNTHAACVVYSRHAYVVVPPFDINEILSSHRFPLIACEFCTYCVLGFPVRTTFASTS